MKIIKAIQVTQSLNEDKTRQRELDGVVDAMKSYELNDGLILTEDEEDTVMVNGFQIEVKPVWKWLLGDN